MSVQPKLWLRNTLDHNLRHFIWGFRCRLVQFGLSKKNAVRITIFMERSLKRFWILG